MIVLIIDDHALVRQAVRRGSEDHFSLAVLRDAATGEEAERIVEAEPVEVAVLDAGRPDCSGLTLLQRIRRLRPRTKCLILTICDDPECIRQALRRGASRICDEGFGGSRIPGGHSNGAGRRKPCDIRTDKGRHDSTGFNCVLQLHGGSLSARQMCFASWRKAGPSLRRRNNWDLAPQPFATAGGA